MLAPPPVGYPELKSGQTTSQLGLDLVFQSMDIGIAKLNFYGAMVTQKLQYCPMDRLAVNGTLGGAYVGADKWDLKAWMVPVSANLVYEAVRFSRGSILVFGGGQFSYSRSTLSPDPTMNSTSESFQNGLSGGAQANLKTGRFIVSPFGRYYREWGTWKSHVEMSSYSDIDESGSIEAIGMWIFGLDVLDQSTGFSLSSMVNAGKDTKSFSMSFRWLLGKWPKDEPAVSAPAS